MNLKELDNFSLSDAIKFHDQLNPALFNDERMKPEVRHKLLEISEEFVDSLGINQLHIKDIVVSGSNAAYSYTDHSDIDLHIITDMNEFNNNNIYLELFTAKKNLFNDDHNIKIKGYDVEVYVQDSNKPVRTLGEYSVLNNKWTKLPSKRRANFDQSSVELKFTKLIQLSELALRDTNIDKLQNLLATLRKYRQAGLDEHGEFGPENLAYKALRTHGYVDKLYDHLNDLISKKLSLDEMIAEQREQLVWLKGKLSGSYTDKQLKDMGARLHNGQWVIPKARFDTLVRLGQLRESKEGKIKLSTDPNWYGATIDNYKATGPVVNISANKLIGFEPDDKMNQPKSKANVEKIVMGLKRGDKLPPLLVRKYKNGYQVLDGHHRFWAYKLVGTKCIPVQVVPDSDIEEISKQDVAEGLQKINWVKPNFDFEWHEVEEQSKMKQVPVDVRQYYQKHFPNKDEWLKAVQNGKTVVVSPDHAYEIRNAPFDKASLQKVLAPTGHEGPIGPAKEKRVNDLFNKGQVEMPIILKTSQGLWLIGGKTRLGTANYVKELPAKVWLISGEQDVAEGSEQITELRDRMYQYIKSIVPKWPDYVVKDWLYQGFGRYNDENPKRRLLTMLNREGLNRNTQWQLVPNMKFTMDMWTPGIVAKLNARAGGKQHPDFEVSRDVERHATQAQLAQKQGGIRSEPVILIKRSDGYELLEGWHRTIQHFHKYPDGYTGPAYIAVAQSKQGVAEASGYIPSEAEKNDPRFKTALTVDIHPNTMKQNAKKLGSKISRAGIPPILKASGKI